MTHMTESAEAFDFFPVCTAAELGNGERIFLEIGQLPIVVFNIAGEYFAIGDLCTHDEGPLGDGLVEGYEIHCPRHGARFDIRSGKVLAFPAVIDIPKYPVQIVDGQIEVGIPVD